ncbi:MAG TPA: hypothetical protein VFE61_16680 [Candidatus Sulfotelmatobacter sp.]|jgi:hypothetical protein|nr:hypothetical protein [Candidatus Sulfotelmatobacter sp.]
MSSAVVSTSAALGRPFVFDGIPDPHGGTAAPGCPVDRSSTAGEHLLQSTISHHKISPSSITLASHLAIRPAPEMASSGAPAIDALTGGLPRGCLTEICGPASSGRTTLLLAALAAATRRGEFCAVVDASDALDPQSAAAAGVELDHLLWVRCGEDVLKNSSAKQKGCPISRASSATEAGFFSQTTFDFDRNQLRENSSRQSERRLEQVLRATDLLLESGGFGLIVLDLGDLPSQTARRIPLTTWFRFRRAVENKPTILLTIEQQPIAGSCSSLLLRLGSSDPMLTMNESVNAAAKLQKNAAHSLPRACRGGVSRGLAAENEQAPEGRKKKRMGDQSPIDSTFPPPAHTHLLTGLDITAELTRSRLDRKPTRSVTFATKTAWAG